MPLRIGINALYLLPGQVGGTEIYLRQLLAALARIPSDAEFFIYTNRETGPDLAPASPRFHLRPQPVTAQSRPARILYEQFSLPAALRQDSVEVLLNPGFTSPRRPGVPSVTVFHDLQHVRHPEYFRRQDLPFWNLLLSQSVRTSRKLIAVSDRTRDDVLVHYRVPADRVVTVPHGVEARYMQIERRPEIEAPFLLCVSTLHPHKNIDRLVRVFPRLRTDHPRVRLILAGLRGFQAPQIERAIGELGLRDHVRVTGWIPNQDLFRLYERAAAFVYPSTFEGFGMPVLEAMAARVPLACSRIEPLASLADGAAKFFDPLDESEMEQALRFVLKPSAELAANVRRGFQRAAQFTWEASAEKTLAVLESVARGPGR